MGTKGRAVIVTVLPQRPQSLYRVLKPLRVLLLPIDQQPSVFHRQMDNGLGAEKFPINALPCFFMDKAYRPLSKPKALDWPDGTKPVLRRYFCKSSKNTVANEVAASMSSDKLTIVSRAALAWSDRRRQQAYSVRSIERYVRTPDQRARARPAGRTA